MRNPLTEEAKEMLYNLFCVALALLAIFLLKDIWIELVREIKWK